VCVCTNFYCSTKYISVSYVYMCVYVYQFLSLDNVASRSSTSMRQQLKLEAKSGGQHRSGEDSSRAALFYRSSHERGRSQPRTKSEGCGVAGTIVRMCACPCMHTKGVKGYSITSSHNHHLTALVSLYSSFGACSATTEDVTGAFFPLRGE